MVWKPLQPPESLRSEARRVYGQDPTGYDAGRPDYPERVYDLLVDRCGLGAGTVALEIGPGTGRVTRRLLDRGARVVAVEPDEVLAAHIGLAFPEDDVAVINASFEDAPLDESGFDLVVAAMSFHWVNHDAGMPKLGEVLRRGGWVALWWTVFGDPDRPDPFRDATRVLLGEETEGDRERFRPPELDRQAWRSQLAERAGLVDLHDELIRWTVHLDPEEVRALYGSMITVRRRSQPERQRLLDALVATATNDFGGVVERPFVTVLYTGRRP